MPSQVVQVLYIKQGFSRWAPAASINYMRSFHLFILSALLLLTAACGQDADPLQAFNKGDYRQSFKLWQPLAEQGDITAQNYLGVQYYLGLGIRQDYAAALKWLGVAAERGNHSAQRSLGIMYANSHGVEQNFVTAYMWYYAAYRQGNERAKKFLDALASEWKLSPNQMKHARKQAEQFVFDPVNPKFDS